MLEQKAAPLVSSIATAAPANGEKSTQAIEAQKNSKQEETFYLLAASYESAWEQLQKNWSVVAMESPQSQTPCNWFIL